MKTTIYLITFILSIFAAIYLANVALGQASLDENSGFNFDRARLNFHIAGSSLLLFLGLAVFSLIKFLKLTREEIQHHKEIRGQSESGTTEKLK